MPYNKTGKKMPVSLGAFSMSWRWQPSGAETKNQKSMRSQAWPLSHRISPLMQGRQNHLEFKATLGYIMQSFVGGGGEKKGGEGEEKGRRGGEREEEERKKREYTSDGVK